MAMVHHIQAEHTLKIIKIARHGSTLEAEVGRHRFRPARAAQQDPVFKKMM